MNKLTLTVFGLCVLCEITGWPNTSPCPALKLKNGRVRYKQKKNFVRFICDTGYLTAGEKYSMCQNGAWDNPVPRCVRASCNKVSPPINGLIYASYRGAVLNFFCKAGYELRGSNVTYCDGTNWDTKLPSCMATNTKPPLSCDFESTDLCGWNHDIQHDFDWKRTNFKTPSGHLGTGPSFDHSKGEGQNGYYMYIESSSRNENDTARLISPIFDKINHTNVCLEFYYHMHGSTTGQLRVYIKKESDSWDLQPKNALFWKMGNHGDRWLLGFINVGPIDEEFQIVVEGVRGYSYFSDIAIDDISIISDCNTATTEGAIDVSDFTYSEDYQPYISCVNRCDEDNLIIPPTLWTRNSCSCNDTCLINNRCCPDYVAVCILGATDDGTGYQTSTDYTEITDSTQTTYVSPKDQSKPQPKLVFLTPTTTELIMKRTRNIEMTSSTVKTVSTAVDEILTVPSKSYTEPEVVYDVSVVPTLSTSGQSLNTRMERYEEVPVGFKTQNQEKIAKKVNLVVIGVASLVVVLLVLIIVGYVVRHSRYVNCHRLGKIKSSSDSQSDVRFLTSDEMLNFNLAHPDD